jgi:hypothetical protein
MEQCNLKHLDTLQHYYEVEYKWPPGFAKDVTKTSSIDTGLDRQELKVVMKRMQNALRKRTQLQHQHRQHKRHSVHAKKNKGDGHL